MSKSMLVDAVSCFCQSVRLLVNVVDCWRWLAAVDGLHASDVKLIGYLLLVSGLC
jgi:hypothetical protein